MPREVFSHKQTKNNDVSQIQKKKTKNIDNITADIQQSLKRITIANHLIFVISNFFNCEQLIK